VKKKLSIVLAVILPVILILTCVTSAVYGLRWPGGVIENFEWGGDGTSLHGRGVGWTVVSAGGSSVAEIETELDDVPSETRCARFYRDGSHNVYARFPLSEPYYIRFYVMKQDTAYADFRIGNGNHCIWVRINSAEELEYYYYPRWRYVCDLDDVETDWYKIAFKNIDWYNGTYDIYVNDSCPPEGEGAEMRDSPGFSGKLYFENLSPSSGSFWIDDILCYYHYSWYW